MHHDPTLPTLLLAALLPGELSSPDPLNEACDLMLDQTYQSPVKGGVCDETQVTGHSQFSTCKIFPHHELTSKL